ncbi:MAG: sensor histidine kinase, partial [Pseudomonadota bacterium]
LHRAQVFRIVLGSASVMAIAIGLLLLASTGTRAAGEVAQLVDGRLNIDLASYALVHEDPDGTATIDEVVSGAMEAEFKPVPGRLIDFGFTESTIWTKVKLRNATDQTTTWRLSHELNVIEDFRVYHVRNGSDGNAEYENTLALTSESVFSERPVSHRQSASDITLEAGEEVTIVIRSVSSQSTQMPLFVETITSFNERVRIEDMLIVAPLAFVAGMAILSTIYLAALGMRAAFLYGTYILLATLHLFHADGYSFQYLWPNAPVWNAAAMGPIGISIGCFGSLFTWAFIDARNHHPKLNVLLPATGFLCAVMAIGFPFFVDSAAYKNAVLVLVVFVSVLNLIAAIVAFRAGQVGSVLFLSGMVLVTSAMVLTVVGYGFPGSFNQDITGHVGRIMLMVEGLVFSLAIFARTQAMRSEHNTTLLARIRLGEEKLQLSEALRSAEQSYQKATDLASRDREAFASAAHDIRQPLTSLRMALMKLGARDAKTAAQVSDSFDYLDQLVASNLDRVATRPDMHHQVADHQPAEIEAFSLTVVTNNVQSMFDAEARAKGLQLRVVPNTAEISANPVDLLRVVSNLVSNAIKYTDAGGVLLTSINDGDGVRIVVADTGIGMDDHEIAHLMQPFQQANDTDGYGLGLSVVRRISREHGYALQLRSKLDKGTIASIMVPLAQSEGTRQRSLSNPHAAE